MPCVYHSSIDTKNVMTRNTRRMGKSGVSPIGEILKEVFPASAMPKGLGEEMQVLGIWAAAVGPDIAKNANPKTMRNGILFVETRHPVWNTELQAKSHLIRRKLNERIGAELVREIHFRLARA